MIDCNNQIAACSFLNLVDSILQRVIPGDQLLLNCCPELDIWERGINLHTFGTFLCRLSEIVITFLHLEQVSDRLINVLFSTVSATTTQAVLLVCLLHAAEKFPCQLFRSIRLPACPSYVEFLCILMQIADWLDFKLLVAQHRIPAFSGSCRTISILS